MSTEPGSDIALGMKVRDTITGYTGTVTGRATYMSSPVDRCQVDTVVDGKLTQEWFDITRLTPDN